MKLDMNQWMKVCETLLHLQGSESLMATVQKYLRILEILKDKVD